MNTDHLAVATQIDSPGDKAGDLTAHTEADKQPEQQVNSALGVFQNITRQTMLGAAGTAGTYMGQMLGCGYVVRVGSNFIYNAVYTQACASSTFGFLSAPFAANSAVGAAVPSLMAAGTVAGGLVGAALSTGAFLLAERVGLFAVSQIRSAFDTTTHNTESPVQTKPMEKSDKAQKSIKAHEVEDIDNEKPRFVKKWGSPFGKMVLPPLVSGSQVVFEI